MRIFLLFFLLLAKAQAEEWMHFGMSASKLIKLRYQGKHWVDREKKREGAFQIEQNLRANIKGNVKERVYVDVDYNDRREQEQKVVLTYKGREGEVVKEAAFGDLYLQIPATEFLGYGKHLFGANASFSLLGRGTLQTIFSRTKGASKKKEFFGRAYQRIEEIKDSRYIKLRYFSLRNDILEGSEKIYFDDGDSLNNFLTKRGRELGLPKDGDFDELSPEKDYILDYKEGMLRMRRDVGKDDVLIIKCTLKDGREWKEIIKDDRTAFDYDGRDRNYELCSFYSLGYKKVDIFDEDFLIKIKDERGESHYKGIPYIQIFGLDQNADGVVDDEFFDEDFGILHFPDPTPFDLKNEDSFKNPYVKNLSDYEKEALSNPYIYISDYAPSRYTIHVEYKEDVEEYFLEPDIVEGSEKVYVDGRLLQKGIEYIIDYESGWLTFLIDIEEDTKIVVEYECRSLFGETQANLFGARLAAPFGPFSIGATYIMEESPKLRRRPGLLSTPQSLKVFGIDINMEKNIGIFTFKGVCEYAASIKNPNTMNEAYIDDMTQSIIQLQIPTSSGSWQPASVPTKEVEKCGPYFEEQTFEREKKEVVVMKFSLNKGRTVGIVHSISKEGEDVTDYEELHIGLKGEELSKYTIYIDIGIVNEDTDNDGVLDTEDKNRDGILNEGEDKGWKFGDYVFGAGNFLLDSEDLDGDGTLETKEGYFTVQLMEEQKIEKGEYNLYKIKVSEFLKEQFWPTQKNRLSPIKHVRVRVKAKEDVEDTLYILSFKFLKSRWKVPQSGNLHLSIEEKEEKKVLLLDFNTKDWEFLERRFSPPLNLSEHKEIRIKREGVKALSLRVGSSENDYFEYLVEEESIKLSEPTKKVGEPNLFQVKYMGIGVKGEGRLKIEEILATEPKFSKGDAKKLELSLRSKRFSFSFLHKDVGEEFRSVGKTYPHQAQRLSQISASFKIFESLPMDFRGRKESTYTRPLYAPELVLRKQGRRDAKGYQIETSFIHKGDKKIGLFYDREDATSFFEERREEERRTWKVSGNHTPLKKENLSLSLSGTYKNPKTLTKVGKKEDYREDRIKDFTAKFSMKPLKNLSNHFLFGYGAMHTKSEKKEDFWLQQQTVFFSVDAEYKKKNIFNVNTNSSINYRECMKKEEEKKDVYTSWNMDIRVGTEPFLFIKPTYSFNMKVSADYAGLTKESIRKTAEKIFSDYYKHALFGKIEEGELFPLRKRASIDCTQRLSTHLLFYKPLSLWTQITRHWRKTQTIGSLSCEATWLWKMDGKCNLLQIKKGLREKLDSLYLIFGILLKRGERVRQPLKETEWNIGAQCGWARKWSASIDYEEGRAEETSFRKHREFKTSLLYRSTEPKKISILWARREWIQEFEARCTFTFRKELQKVQNIKRVDKSLYNMELSAKYRLSQHLYFTFSGTLGYNKDRVKAGEDHYLYGGGAELQICF